MIDGRSSQIFHTCFYKNRQQNQRALGAGNPVLWAVTMDGLRKGKYQLTQDLSFSLIEEDMSINPEMFYGWCISHVIHVTVTLTLPGHHLRRHQFSSGKAEPHVAILIPLARHFLHRLCESSL